MSPCCNSGGDAAWPRPGLDDRRRGSTLPETPRAARLLGIVLGMRQGAWAKGAAWERLRAAARNDVIRAHTLVALGVPESTVYARCRPGGPWQLLLPATVLLSSGQPTPDQLVVAGLLYAGPGAVLTGIEAAHRHGVRRGPVLDGRVHVLVPHDQQPASARHVVIERTRRMPCAVVRRGVPLAPVARAVVDGARRLASPREATELLADAVQRGLCTVGQLASEVEAAQQRGTAVPRAILRDVSAGTRSVAERDAKAVWRRSGLPEPWWNASVYDAQGALLGIVDAWWDDVALAWEINSLAWHLNPQDYAREQAKTALFTAAGVPVLPTLPKRLGDDAAAVLRELQDAYRHAASRSRPQVRAVRCAGPIAAG
jgi:hypothetical protein